ncbi:MAG: S-layer homology domain-containing protein, partial [Chloroflexota bacterium]|nr:S-layer homology domain-containing protein [Chloroflexota bacterium]
MKEPNVQGRNWKPWAVLLMLMFVAALSAGAAFAALPAKQNVQGLAAAPNAPQAVLWDQYDSANASVYSSCHSESVNCNNTRHSQVADDFVVPGGQTWTLDEVDVNGNLIGSSEPASFNVYFYNDSSTLPGTVVMTYSALSYVGSAPAYTITIPSTVLGPGTYWVSVQANYTSGTSNWQWTSRPLYSTTNGAAFRGTVVGGCPNWVRKPSCFGGTYSDSPDQLFRLGGTVQVDATATPTNTNTPTNTATATHVAAPELYCQITSPSDPIQSTTNFGSQTADDFVVPAGPGWSITQVDVAGSTSPAGNEPPSFNVFFYNDSGTVPGTVVVSHTNITLWTKDVSTSIYTINIPQTDLAPGTYWVSVQAVGGNNWFWSGHDPQTGDGAAIRGGSCGSNWVDRNSCSATSPYTSQDQAFCVRGGIQPTPTSTSTSTSTATDTATQTSTSTNTPTQTNTSTGTVIPPTNTTVPSSTNTAVPPTNTVAPTNTSGPATSTSTSVAGASSTATVAASGTVVSGGTATAVATVCTINFPDNQPGDTFYQFIRCLACRGIVTGFPDGMFHAERNITRGQISKVVSNAAGFSEDPGPQIYQDVPPGSPYYAYINRLTNRGIMSGYPCPERPSGDGCSPDNPVIFLPNANA